MNLGSVLTAIGPVLMVAMVLAGGYPWIKGKAREAAYNVVKEERDAERDARVAGEQRCKQEIAELRGQVVGLQERYATVIAEKVAERVAEVVTKALDRGGTT